MHFHCLVILLLSALANCGKTTKEQNKESLKYLVYKNEQTNTYQGILEWQLAKEYSAQSLYYSILAYHSLIAAIKGLPHLPDGKSDLMSMSLDEIQQFSFLEKKIEDTALNNVEINFENYIDIAIINDELKNMLREDYKYLVSSSGTSPLNVGLQTSSPPNLLSFIENFQVVDGQTFLEYKNDFIFFTESSKERRDKCDKIVGELREKVKSMEIKDNEGTK